MLSAQAQSRTIDGVTYEVMPLPALVAVRVMARALKMAAPGFASVSSLREASSAVGAVIAGGLAELDEDVLVGIAQEFAKATSALYTDGRKVPLSGALDEHFRGRVVALFEWLRFAAEVTYGPLGEALQKMTAAPLPASPSAG